MEITKCSSHLSNNPR